MILNKAFVRKYMLIERAGDLQQLNIIIKRAKIIINQ